MAQRARQPYRPGLGGVAPAARPPGGLRRPGARDPGPSRAGRGPRRAAGGPGSRSERGVRGGAERERRGRAGRRHQRGRDAGGGERQRCCREPRRQRPGRRERGSPGRGGCPRRRPGRRQRGALPDSAVPAAWRRGARLSGVHHALRRGGRGERAVQPGRARPPAHPARPAARPLAGDDRPARQPLAASSVGAADPVVELRPRRRPARHRAPDPGRGQPRARPVLQAGEGHRVPRHGGLAADRQLRLDARSSDRGRRDVRRHPGAHAGALRRQGRAARASPPAAGRAGRAASSGCARASGPTPAASTTCATSSTSRPTARGGAPGATSA